MATSYVRTETPAAHAELLATFVEQSADGIVVLDERGRIIEWNPAHERLTGISRERALGAAAWDVQATLLPPAGRVPGAVEHLRSIILEALRTGQSPMFERPYDFEMLSPSGETRYLQQQSFAIRTADGFRLGAITRDFSALRKAREDTIEQARQLKAVGDLAIELAEVAPDADFYAIIADRLRTITGALGVVVSTYDPSSSSLIVRRLGLADNGLLARASQILGNRLIGMRVPLGPEALSLMLGGHVLRTASPTELTYGAIGEGVGRLLASTLGLGENVGCGLQYAGQPVGSIVFLTGRGSVRLPDPLVEALCRVVTVALRRHHVEYDRARLNRALRTTSECNQTLVRATSETQLVESICRIVVEIGGYRMAWIGFHESDSLRSIKLVAHFGHEDGFLQAFPRFLAGGSDQVFRVAETFKAGQPAIVRDIATDELYAPWREAALARGYESAIFFPLMDVGEDEPKDQAKDEGTDQAANERKTGGELLGVLAMYDDEPNSFDPNEVALLTELAGDLAFGLRTLRLREAHRQAGETILRSSTDLARAYDSTLEGWSRALELRERETAGHSQRVVGLTVQVAREMGLSEEAVVHVRRGALLHDIGKMGVPDAILLKPGPLDDVEWQVMRKHPEFARALLADIAYLDRAIEIPYCHHERWDGEGYPNRLRGEAIPLAARIFAVADVWDALTCDRPYRRAWSEEKTAAYLAENAGTHFDPAVVAAFLRMRERT